jgi:hypothetical protein
MVELRGLGCKMAGDALVEPALDLGGQIKNFDGHGVVLFKSGFVAAWSPNPHDAYIGVRAYIAYLDDIFQYLSVNIL